MSVSTPIASSSAEALKVPMREEDGTVIPHRRTLGSQAAAGRSHLPRRRLREVPRQRLQRPNGLYEVLMITEEIRRLAIRNADSGQIKAAALAQGMRTLRDDGALKVVRHHHPRRGHRA
jgi:general secretion pathway protein E